MTGVAAAITRGVASVADVVPPRVLRAEREYAYAALVPSDAREYAALDRLICDARRDATTAIVVNRPIDRATRQLQAGTPFRTIWDAVDAGVTDPGTWTRNDGYLAARAQREEALGFGRDTIYGSLAFDRPGAIASGTTSYGAVGFVLDDVATRQSTLAPGDSLDDRAIRSLHVAPARRDHDVLTNAIHAQFEREVERAGGWRALAARDAARAEQLVAAYAGTSNRYTSRYVEAQWHPAYAGERLTLDHVREVRVTYPMRRGFETDASVHAALPELRAAAAARDVPVVVTNPADAPR